VDEEVLLVLEPELALLLDLEPELASLLELFVDVALSLLAALSL
jgi:hypothetical protein